MTAAAIIGPKDKGGLSGAASPYLLRATLTFKRREDRDNVVKSALETSDALRAGHSVVVGGTEGDTFSLAAEVPVGTLADLDIAYALLVDHGRQYRASGRISRHNKAGVLSEVAL